MGGARIHRRLLIQSQYKGLPLEQAPWVHFLKPRSTLSFKQQHITTPWVIDSITHKTPRLAGALGIRPDEEQVRGGVGWGGNQAWWGARAWGNRASASEHTIHNGRKVEHKLPVHLDLLFLEKHTGNSPSYFIFSFTASLVCCLVLHLSPSLRSLAFISMITSYCVFLMLCHLEWTRKSSMTSMSAKSHTVVMVAMFKQTSQCWCLSFGNAAPTSLDSDCFTKRRSQPLSWALDQVHAHSFRYGVIDTDMYKQQSKCKEISLGQTSVYTVNGTLKSVLWPLNLHISRDHYILADTFFFYPEMLGEGWLSQMRSLEVAAFHYSNMLIRRYFLITRESIVV